MDRPIRMFADAFPPPTDAEWAAITARERGSQLYAVRTTGIVCRSGCPARTPLRGNVIVPPSVSAAEAAGFRTCLRRRPA